MWLSSKNRLTATWVRDRPDLYQQNGPAKDAARQFTGVLDRVNITYTTFRPSWSAETRYGWNRVDNTRLDTFFNLKDPNKQETKLGDRRIPGISALGFGIQGENNFIGNAPQWNIEQKITWQIGRHSLKAGGILSRRRFGEGDVGNPVLFYNTEQDLITNNPVDAQFNFGFDPWVGRQIDFGLFIQDDWRVSRKLVLNLGLRYDYFDHMIAEGLHGGPPHFANASFSNFAGFVLSPFRPYDNAYDSDKFSMGPRLGFAYNPDGNGKTVVRGGAGFMHAPVNTSIFEQSAINSFNQPFRIDLSRTDAQRLGLKFPVYNEDVLPLVGAGSAAPAYQLVDPQIHTPYAINYTLGIEHALSSTLMFETAFVGTRGVKFVLPRIYNQPDPDHRDSAEPGAGPVPLLGQFGQLDIHLVADLYAETLRQESERRTALHLGQDDGLHVWRHYLRHPHVYPGLLRCEIKPRPAADGRATQLGGQLHLRYSPVCRRPVPGEKHAGRMAGKRGFPGANRLSYLRHRGQRAGVRPARPHRSGERRYRQGLAILESRGLSRGSGQPCFRPADPRRQRGQRIPDRAWAVEPGFFAGQKFSHHRTHSIPIPGGHAERIQSREFERSGDEFEQRPVRPEDRRHRSESHPVSHQTGVLK